MPGSLKDALEKAGVTSPAKTDTPSPKPAKEWLHELPDDDEHPPYVPFDAPAITKVKEKPRR
jgi:hypothetical protein